MQSKSQLVCLWSGYAFFPLYLLGIVVVAGFIPPPSPVLDGQAIVDLFEQGRTRILFGMLICIVASALFVPWSVAITAQMRRIEDGEFPVFTWVQALSGVAGAVFFILSPLVWAAMAFRTGHDPDVLLILNDFAWLSWLISWPFFFVQEFALGLCVLVCKSRQTIFPRWLAFYAMCSATTMFPVLMVVFFRTGPFAWTGLFGIYLPLSLYAIWFHLVTHAVYRGIRDTDPPGLIQGAESGRLHST
jgi:hypothetical protein